MYCPLELLIFVTFLCSIDDGDLKPVEGELSKSLLDNNRCCLLDCGDEVFVWVGRLTQVDERKTASTTAEVEMQTSSKVDVWEENINADLSVYMQGYIASQIRPKSTRITKVIQGYETHAFKSNFKSWPQGSLTPSAEEGRGKVAGGHLSFRDWTGKMFFHKFYQ